MVSLSWSDVDPRKHAFDKPHVYTAISRVVRAHAATFGRRTARRKQIEVELDRAILESAGLWASGWRWSPTEPGGGGPTRGWCCASDSVFRHNDRDADATIERAFAAVADWRAVLEALDARFAMLRVETTSLTTAKEIELAASRLLVFVFERTGAEDAWYSTFSRALIWYLEAAGITDGTAHGRVKEIVRGRFESWVAPDEAVAIAACTELGAAIGDLVGDGELRDALADWCRVRETPPDAGDVPSGAHHAVSRDGHDDYILEHDLARDAERAERMAAALILCRDSAARGMPLTFDQLAEWQRVVLGAPGPVPLRTTDAFAKHGRECYRITPDLRVDFDRALAQASDRTHSVAVRAARVYLDVCFFHPFADGNARAARLALDHVLTSSGLALQLAAPVFAISRGAADPRGLWSLAFVIERCLGARP